MSEIIKIGEEAANAKERPTICVMSDGTKVRFGPYFVYYYQQMLQMQYRHRIEIMALTDFDLWLYLEERAHLAANILEQAVKAKWVDGIENQPLLFGNAQDNNNRFGIPLPASSIIKRFRALTLAAAAAKDIFKWFCDDEECRPHNTRAVEIREHMKEFLKNA